MNKRKKRRRKKQIREGRIITITIVALFILFGYSKIYQMQITSDLQKEKEQLQAEIEMINQEIEALDDSIIKSQSLEFIERSAREDYNMVKPREIIYIFEDSVGDQDGSDN